MSARPREDGGADVALAFLRITLLVVIFLGEKVIASVVLAGWQFYVVLGLAGAYSVAGIIIALRPGWMRGGRVLAHLQPGLDLLFLAGLTYTSGGAFSDVRKAFFVLPLAAAFSERTRSTAKWSVLALGAFSLQALIAGGHPRTATNSWQRLTLDEDLYLAWTAAAATMLALTLRRRTAHTEGLAQSRQRLVTQAIDAIERERARLAGALHDSPVQNLIAARHDLRRAERSADPESFRRLHEALDATIAELREEIFNLHPHVLDHVGLRAALEQVARRHAAQREMRVMVEIDSAGAMADRQVLFALGRELLSNAAKHANASEVRLNLTCQGDCVTLQVSDDGRGIAEGRMRQALLDGHIGLAAVTERVAALGGTLTIETAPGDGTCVRITLPVSDSSDRLDPAEEHADHRRRTPRLRAPHRQVPASQPELGRRASTEASDRVTREDTLRVSPI